MDNAWIIAFYKETDPVKRLELLKANTGDGESEKDKYRKQLWIARYGKRTPVKDEFMRCLMEMKYLAEGTTVDLGGKRLRGLGVNKGIPVVFSTEIANPDAVVEVEGEQCKRTTTGTVSYMPAIFGCYLASYVINQLKVES